MMKIAGDTHTHTLMCTHAYSTILENIAQAKAIGHDFLCSTEHAPALPNTVPEAYFRNLPKTLPRVINGVVHLSGCEVNILEDGTFDLSDAILSKLDWVIASMHSQVLSTDLGKEAYTNLWLKAAENPYVDCIGHLGQDCFPTDYERVVRAFAANHKVVEVNSHSPIARPGSEHNCPEIIRLCKQYGVKLVLSSDAHFALDIGQVDWSARLVEEAGVPEEQVINTTYERFRQALAGMRGVQLPDLKTVR